MKAAPLLSALLMACGGPSLRGATSLDPENDPALPPSATLRSEACSDARGAPAASIALEYALVATTLIERRSGHDSVVIQNAYADGAARIFAYVSDDAQHGKLLHRIRLENSATSGELSVSRAYATHDTPAGFRVDRESAVLRCKLTPLQRDADAANGDASR